MKNIKFLTRLLVVCFSFFFLSCSTEDTPQIQENQTIIPLKDYSHSSFEIELLNLVNQDRVSKDLNALTIINEISYLASTHNDYMITTGIVSHDNFQQRAYTLKTVLNALSISENVAFGYNTPASTLAAWNASTEHRINLEGNFTHFGLSVKSDASGMKYYTLIFIRK